MMTVFQDRYYPFRIWLTAIVAGSVIFTVYDILSSDEAVGILFDAFMRVLFANVILSLPGLVIFVVGFRLLNRLQMSIASKRFVVILLAFGLFLLTWYGINKLFERDVFFSAKSLFIYVDFLLCIIVSSFLYGR
jgi:hypothetical protein